jgi:uncharacterized membrane protein YccC
MRQQAVAEGVLGVAVCVGGICLAGLLPSERIEPLLIVVAACFASGYFLEPTGSILLSGGGPALVCTAVMAIGTTDPLEGPGLVMLAFVVSVAFGLGTAGHAFRRSRRS